MFLHLRLKDSSDHIYINSDKIQSIRPNIVLGCCIVFSEGEGDFVNVKESAQLVADLACVEK